MPRLINIVHRERKNILENYHNIDISDIDNIINYSADLIRFDHIQLFDQKTSEYVLSALISKLKLGGSLVVCLYNIQNITKLYVDLILSDEQFLSKIQDCKSIWSSEFFNDFISKRYAEVQVVKIQYDHPKHLTYITLERKSL